MIILKTLFSGDFTANTTPQTAQLDSGASTSRGWLIKAISFYNLKTNTAPIILDVFVSLAGGTSTFLYKGYSLAVDHQLLITAPIALNHVGTPDSISIHYSASSSQSFQCVVNGIERDQ